MFVCKPCLEKRFKNKWVGLCLSHGPCEICEIVTTCDDFPSKYLVSKNKNGK